MSDARPALQISCLKRAAVFFAFLPHATALDHRIFPPANGTCVILVIRDVAILTGGVNALTYLCPALPLSSPKENVVYFSQLVCALHHRNRVICVGGSGFSVVWQHSPAPGCSHALTSAVRQQIDTPSPSHNFALPPKPIKTAS